MVGLSSYMFALRFGHSNLYSHQGEDELGRDAADSRRFANDQSLVHLEEEHVHFDFFFNILSYLCHFCASPSPRWCFCISCDFFVF